MKTVTIDEFLGFHPCWGEDKVREIAGNKTEWTALEVLRLENVSEEDRLWAVLREEFVDAEILHELACRCAERALSMVANPDSRSVAAIGAKRAWLRGEITNEELSAAMDSSWAAAREAAWAASWDSARANSRGVARDAAWDAAWAAVKATSRNSARDVAWAASFVASSAAKGAARDAALAVERELLVAELVKMLEGQEL